MKNRLRYAIDHEWSEQYREHRKIRRNTQYANDPLYRMNHQIHARKQYEKNILKRRAYSRTYAIRKKLLKDPNLETKLAQAVLVQLRQLGFPTSVLKGVFQ
jgi:hypothetical protein